MRAAERRSDGALAARQVQVALLRMCTPSTIQWGDPFLNRVAGGSSLPACEPSEQDGVLALLDEVAERIVSLTLGHLTSASVDKLTAGELSVHAYPSRYGGFVYVGKPAYDQPDEQDLAVIFRFAEQAGIAWLHFDACGATVDGLPLYAA